jgi:hypothetical protein
MTSGLLDEAADPGEPEAGAVADFLGGEERIEYARQQFGGNAGPVVGNRKFDDLPMEAAEGRICSDRRRSR